MRIAFAALMSLAGCATTPQSGVLAVEVREVDDANVACQAIEGRPLIARRSLGCSVWGRTPCLIVIGKISADPKPRELETLGHELLHCMRGRWHT